RLQQRRTVQDQPQRRLRKQAHVPEGEDGEQQVRAELLGGQRAHVRILNHLFINPPPLSPPHVGGGGAQGRYVCTGPRRLTRRFHFRRRIEVRSPRPRPGSSSR